MKNMKSIQTASGRSQPSTSSSPIAERVAAPAATIPDEYWFPAVRRPRRANLWNTLANTRHIQPA